MKKYLLTNIFIILILSLHGCNFSEKTTSLTSSSKTCSTIPPAKSDNFSIILDQTFNISLENFGDITFTSYAPNKPEIILKNSKKHTDVSFRLFKEGEFIYEFPTPSEISSALELWIYESIDFITFTDVNQDGLKDIVMNINYYVENGPSAFQPFHTTRIYLAKDKNFILDEKLMESIPYELNDAKSVINYIKEFYSQKKE